MDLKRLAAEERADLADFLATLEPEQWQVRSLSADWSVHDVVAHVISYEELGPFGLLGRFVRGGFRPDRVNALGVREYGRLTPDELVGFLRHHLRPRGLTAAFGGGIGLTDAVIHHQDIRRALQLPRQVPSDRLRAVLPIALSAPVLPAKRLVRGLTMVATDLTWHSGEGPEVTGPAEALLMVTAGRAAALPELDGPGLPVLSGRMS